jgi:hypothetical protein
MLRWGLWKPQAEVTKYEARAIWWLMEAESDDHVIVRRQDLITRRVIG